VCINTMNEMSFNSSMNVTSVRRKMSDDGVEPLK
jgi:hypothetical protein